MSSRIIRALSATAVAAGLVWATALPADAAVHVRGHIYVGPAPSYSACWRWSRYRQDWVWTCQRLSYIKHHRRHFEKQYSYVPYYYDQRPYYYDQGPSFDFSFGGGWHHHMH